MLQSFVQLESVYLKKITASLIMLQARAAVSLHRPFLFSHRPLSLKNVFRDESKWISTAWVIARTRSATPGSMAHVARWIDQDRSI